METVLELGDPRLRVVSLPVDPSDPALPAERERLQRALGEFRARRGFGRAISAPQIGIARRFIAFCLGDRSFVTLDPEVTWSSPETFTMWDDCMSFPSLLVRVRRAQSISVRWRDEHGASQSWERMPRDVAELFQHEIDHLEGILAVDRAEGRDALVTRAAFESNRARLRAEVDYVIGDSVESTTG